MKITNIITLVILVTMLSLVESHGRRPIKYYEPYRRIFTEMLQNRYPWLPQRIPSNGVPLLGSIIFNHPAILNARTNAQQWRQIFPNTRLQQSFIPIRQEFIQPRNFLQQRNNTLSCQESGCRSGDECVFSDRWVCPKWIPYLNCRCTPGCRYQNTFIPFGKAVVIDKCGNKCSCMSIYGSPECHFESC